MFVRVCFRCCIVSAVAFLTTHFPLLFNNCPRTQALELEDKLRSSQEFIQEQEARAERFQQMARKYENDLSSHDREIERLELESSPVRSFRAED